MTQRKHENKIITDAAQVLNDYRAAQAALGLPYSATPLEVRERIEKMKRDAVDLALLFDEILGTDRVSGCDDFRAAISKVQLLHKTGGRAITYYHNDGGGICHYHSGCKDCLEKLDIAEGAK